MSDPAYQTELGRAMERGRKRRSARREQVSSRIQRTGLRKFKLRTFYRLRGSAIVLAVGVSLSLAAGAAFSNSSTGPKLGFWTVALVTAIFFLPFGLLSLIDALHELWRHPSTVIVGSDGVLVGKRFVPYAQILTVDPLLKPRTISRPVYGDHHEDEAWYEWTLSLWTSEGEIALMHRFYRTDSGDPLGNELASALDAGLEAWHAGQRPDELELEVARGARTGSQWLEALRGLGTGGNASYRSATVHLARLSQLLDDRWTKPSIRAAAAVALAASGDAEAAQKLRITAETMANPRLRIALETVAEGTADSVIAGALEELEDLERDEPTDTLARS